MNISDLGDLEFPFGDKATVLSMIATQNSRKLFKSTKKPLFFGGEHLISYPILQSCVEAYPNLNVIHLDAHADLANEYLSESQSHATVMHRVLDIF